MALPPPLDPRTLCASLISSLRRSDLNTTNPDQDANPLRNADQHTQKALLTLHVLFPNELLPALDLLDRNLVTRLILQQSETQQPESPVGSRAPSTLQPEQAVTTLTHESNVGKLHDQERPPSPTHRSRANPTPHQRQPAEVYLVRSAQAPSRARSSHHHHHHQHIASYEVRLHAWSCSCPAFAFAAFPAAASEADDNRSAPSSAEDRGGGGHGWKFGGATLGGDMPVCKHLLACVLVEYSDLFAGLAEEREVSGEALAGYAAGWAD